MPSPTLHYPADYEIRTGNRTSNDALSFLSDIYNVNRSRLQFPIHERCLSCHSQLDIGPTCRLYYILCASEVGWGVTQWGGGGGGGPYI